jgi:stage II sporulation protein E
MLKKLRYSHSGVIAYGGRRKTVAIKGLDASRAKIGVKDLRGELERVLGILLADPVFVPVGSRFDVTVTTRRRYTVKQSYSSVASPEEKVKNICGDNVCGFETVNDHYYTLLCDGMGTGKEAALTSRIAGMFLEKMLTAGNRPETSVRLLNSFMSERDGSVRHECSVTADLLEFDLINGQLSMLKSGASPTYIKRGDNCFKLRSSTLPLGILDTPDIERIKFDVEPGDRIIMVSDGVTQNREDCAWITNMLINGFDCDGQAMAKKITDRAKSEGSEDDITAIVIEIEEAA